MEAIGQLLLERGWISEEQLAAALRRQEELGGRLGTALLELDAVSEDLLAKLLAEQAAVPAVAIEDLLQVPPEVIELLPAKVAKAHFAIPFRGARSRVDLAVRDVPDIASIDELSFVLGKQARVYVANEARIYEALERYYGKSCPLRITHLLQRLNRSRQRSRPAETPGPQGAAVTVTERAARAVQEAAGNAAGDPAVAKQVAARPAPAPPAPQSQARQKSVPLSEEEKQALGRDRSAEAVKPLSLDGVGEALMVARSVDDIGKALLGFLGQEFLRLMLFRIDKDGVRGWLGRSPAFDQYRFHNWRLAFNEPSVFLNLRQGAELFVGKLPPMSAHQRLLACWRGSLDTECAIFPVRVRNRLVCAVYGDRDSLGLAGLDVQMVQRLTAKAEIAFEMLIMRRKLGSL